MEVKRSATATSKKSLEAFSAIVSFVNDLWEVFGSTKTVTPLALYHRLIEHIKFTDSEGIQKAIAGFTTFMGEYETILVKNELSKIPRDTFIRYGDSDKVYLEIQKYLYLARNDTCTIEVIRQHLLTICTILDPNKEKIAELEKRINELKVDTSTREGQFITGIMEKAKTTMEGVDTDDPMKAMMGIFSSGVIQEMVSGLQQGVGSGEMDMQRLLGTMQSAIGAIMPATAGAGVGTPGAPMASASAAAPPPAIEDIQDRRAVSTKK